MHLALGIDLEIEQTWQDLGWKLGSGSWEEVKKIINQELVVEIFQDCGSIDWQTKLLQNHSFYFDSPEIGELRQPQARIWISYIQRRFAKFSDFSKVQWHPPVLWLGVGLRKEVCSNLLSDAIKNICRSHHFAEVAIAGIATIENKLNHPAILALAEKNNWQLKSYSTAQLDQVNSPTKSDLIRAAIGTASVAEAAAMLAANQSSLLVTKTIYAGAITLAIAIAQSEK